MRSVDVGLLLKRQEEKSGHPYFDKLGFPPISLHTIDPYNKIDVAPCSNTVFSHRCPRDKADCYKYEIPKKEEIDSSFATVQQLGRCHNHDQ